MPTRTQNEKALEEAIPKGPEALEPPQEVARKFCWAITLGNEEEARSYCAKDFIYDDIDLLMTVYKREAKGGFFDFNFLLEVANKAVLIICFADYNLKSYIKPNRITRLVLELDEKQWKIKHARYQEEFLPASISWGNDVDMLLKEETIFTNEQSYYLQLNEPCDVRMDCNYDQEFYTVFSTRCTRVELFDRGPEFAIKFFQSDNLEAICKFYFIGLKEIKFSKINDLYLIKTVK